MAAPRSGWRGAMMVHRSGRLWRSCAVGLGDDGVLALVRAGGDQQRAAAERRLQPLELGSIDRRRRRVDLEVAGGDRARRAQRLEAARERLVLRQHQLRSG